MRIASPTAHDRLSRSLLPLDAGDAADASPAERLVAPMSMPHRVTAPRAVSVVPHVFDVTADDPELGLRVGDRVIITYGAAWPVTVIRSALPNYGRLLGLLEGGTLEPRDATDPEAVIRLLRAWSAQQARPTLQLVPRDGSDPQ